MPRVTLIFNGKGGVGKTTTAHAIATGLPRYFSNTKTLAIDYEPSNNLSILFGADVLNAPTMCDVMRGSVSIRDAIQHTPQGDIIVGGSALTNIEALYNNDDYPACIFRLKEQIALLKDSYTHIFMDNQPLVGGLLTLQAMTAATDLIVPVTADRLAFEGVKRIDLAISNVRKAGLNPNIKIDGVLITKCRPRENSTKAFSELYSRWAKSYDSGVYMTSIREKKEVKDAQALSQSIFDYAPSSVPARDFRTFFSEYLWTDKKVKYSG